MGFQHPPEGDTISPGQGRVVELLPGPAVGEERHELVLEGQRWEYEPPRGWRVGETPAEERYAQMEEDTAWHAEELGFRDLRLNARFRTTICFIF